MERSLGGEGRKEQSDNLEKIAYNQSVKASMGLDSMTCTKSELVASN